MGASEIKYVYGEWEEKGQTVLMPHALQCNFEEIDRLLKDMDDTVQEAGLGGIGYHGLGDDITKLTEWAAYLNAYIGSLIPELQEQLDKPLYIAFNHHATESLSRIRMEDYTTENKLGLKRWTTVPGTEGVPTQELVEDPRLSMEDFLGLTVMGDVREGKLVGMPEEFRDFTDMFAVDYNTIKEQLKTQDGKEVTLEDYLLSLKSAGEFDHKMDKPLEEFISAVLDITAVKPLIECCTGYDMITGEDLTDFERGMKAVSGVVSLFTLGQGSIMMSGGKIALGESLKMGAKMLAIDAISTGVSYGTSEICQALGCPGGLTLVLSLMAGMGTSAGLGSRVYGKGGATPDDIEIPIDSLRNRMTFEEIKRYDEYWYNVADKLSNEALDIHIQYIRNNGITKPNGGQYRPAKVSATVDMRNGNIYYGYNGAKKFNPSRSEICDILQERIDYTKDLATHTKGNIYADRNSFEKWSVDNCAEVYSVNNALKNGANLNELFLNTKYFKNGEYAPLCKNCQVTFKGIRIPNN